jgi:hypothetical protein
MVITGDNHDHNGVGASGQYMGGPGAGALVATRAVHDDPGWTGAGWCGGVIGGVAGC